MHPRLTVKNICIQQYIKYQAPMEFLPAIRVHQPGGNRSGPVPVWAGTKPAQIQNLNLNLKNKKFLKKLQGATNLMVSNFLKNSFI